MLKIAKEGKSQMRSKNTVLVFIYILQNGPISRKEIEKNLKISGPTITRIVDKLLTGKLVKEVPIDSNKVGRNPIPLVVNDENHYFLGLSITDTEIKVEITTLSLVRVYSYKEDIKDINSNEEYLSLIDGFIEKSLKAINITKNLLWGIGVATRGPVNMNEGIILRLKFNKSDVVFHDIPVKNYLKDKYSCNIIVDNNINAELHREYFLKNDISKINSDNFLYIYMSSGVGGSSICNTKQIRSRFNNAGQIGHMIVERNGKICSCGKRGHLEAYASNYFIESEYKAQTGEEINTLKISNEAFNGNEVAYEIITSAIDKLAMVIVNTQLIIDAQTIFIAGDIFSDNIEAKNYLYERLKYYFYDESLLIDSIIYRDKSKIKFEHSIIYEIISNIVNP